MLEVLGRGGLGSVYQARFSGPDGFEKLVAIKLLNESATAPEVLERFRDEARILDLLRDRAVIHVDAPVRLGAGGRSSRSTSTGRPCRGCSTSTSGSCRG